VFRITAPARKIVMQALEYLDAHYSVDIAPFTALLDQRTPRASE